jgi:hypothetical protein
MRNRFLEWTRRHFAKIAITVGILNLLMGNFVIGSLWILIWLTDYQDKLDV